LAQSSAMICRLVRVGSIKYTAGTSGIGSRSVVDERRRWSVTPRARSWDTERRGEIIVRHGLS
jgi:hypothetical protein